MKVLQILLPLLTVESLSALHADYREQLRRLRQQVHDGKVFISTSNVREVAKNAQHVVHRKIQEEGSAALAPKNADCKVDKDCKHGGKCNDDWECDCKGDWEGDTCDDEKKDYDVKVLAVGLDAARMRSEPCRENLKRFVDNIEKLNEKTKNNLPDVTFISSDAVNGQCGDNNFADGLERLARGGGRNLRNLKNNKETFVFGAAIDTRALGDTSGCLRTLEKTAEDMADNWSDKKLKKANGKVIYLSAGDCNKKDVKKMLEHA